MISIHFYSYLKLTNENSHVARTASIVERNINATVILWFVWCTTTNGNDINSANVTSYCGCTTTSGNDINSANATSYCGCTTTSSNDINSTNATSYCGLYVVQLQAVMI